MRCLHIGSKTERWSRSLDDGAILALALHPSPGCAAPGAAWPIPSTRMTSTVWVRFSIRA